MRTVKIKELVIEKINQSYWWHVPPQDPDAYKKRGKFLASTYLQAEFYGRPNLEPEKVNINNPIFGFSEDEILKELFPKNWKALLAGVANGPDDLDDAWYSKRIGLDRAMALAAKRKGFDSIVLLAPQGQKALRRKRKPNSIELNLLGFVS